MRQTNQPGPVPGAMIQPGSQPMMGYQASPPFKKVPGLMGLSIVHIVLGILSAVFGVVALILRCNLSYVGSGLWSGVVFFGVTGTLGLIGATGKINGVVIAHLVMAVISTVVAFQLLVVATVAATDEYYCGYGYCSGASPRIAIDSLLAITGLAEMVIAIVSSSLSCYGICTCCRPYAPVMVQYMPQQAMTQVVPMMPVQSQQQQQQQQGPLQQQSVPLQVPAAMQGQIGSPYVTNYRASPTQQMAYSPQQVAYAPQPVGQATPMEIAPQPISMPPQQVVVSVPTQAAATAPVEAGNPTAEIPHPDANQGGTEHFHHDDKEGLLETV